MCFDNTHFDDIELKKPDLYDFFQNPYQKINFRSNQDQVFKFKYDQHSWDPSFTRMRYISF